MTTHPVFRGLHDIGLAAWTGGSLMGAVGLDGAGNALDDPRQRARLATAGWGRWAPVGTAALGAHLVGATGLLVTDWPRVRRQQGVAATSAAKTATTAAAVGLAVWSAVLDRTAVRAGSVPVRGAAGTNAAAATPDDVAGMLRQRKLLQWLQPAVGLALVALTDVMSEQQRASEMVRGRLARLLPGRALPVTLAAATAAALLLRRRRAAQARAGVAQLPAGAAGPGTSGPAGPAGLGTTAPAGAAGRGRTAEGTDSTTTVTVRHDEPRLVREPVDAGAVDAPDRPALQEEEREVVLHAEEPVLTTEATDTPARGSARQ